MIGKSRSDRIESVTKVRHRQQTDRQTNTNVRTWIFIAALHKSPSGAINLTKMSRGCAQFQISTHWTHDVLAEAQIFVASQSAFLVVVEIIQHQCFIKM